MLGSGCIACERTAFNVQTALDELGVHVDVEEVRDPRRIFMYAVSAMPAVLIDDMVACQGRIATIDEMKDWIKQVETWRSYTPHG